MGQALHSIASQPDHSVEVIVHISENLGGQDRGKLTRALEQDSGILSAEFCPLRYHLMLVRYDRDSYSSQDVLQCVRSQQLTARLIGPV